MFFEPIKRLSKTVGVRIALWHSAIFITGAILVFTAAYFLLRVSVDEQTRDLIEFRLSQFAWEHERAGAQGVIDLCKMRTGRANKAFFVRMADAQNRTTFLRDAADWAEFKPQTLALNAPPDDLVWTGLKGLEGSVLRIATRRMADGSVLQVGKTLEGGRDLLASFRTALVIIAAIVIAAGVAGGASVAFRALRPVRDLTANVRSILNTGEFAARVPSRGTGDEIDELIRCFNLMLEKIGFLIRGMRDSLDNVAHDLRTPMTRLRILAAKAVEQNYDKEAALEVLSECLEESERVLTMLVTLMDIAEAETGVMKLDMRAVSVARIAAKVVELYQHVAEDKRIEITVDVPSNLEISADEGRLLRALGNLMDNALKYTRENGRISIRATARQAGVAIEVADTGEGISKAEMDRIWERLYRVDKSRSQRGLGLGLSFVKAITEAHGGKVSLRSVTGSGLRFTLELPR